MMAQLQALGYQVTDLDWIRDKLEIPSLEKGEIPGMDGMTPGMGESTTVPGSFPKGIVHQKGDDPEPMVLGEKALGHLVSRNTAENLDFAEFDEDGDLKDQTVRDRVAKQIAERFNSGGISEIGWDRIATGISSSDSETSKITIDEYTSPGDIVYTVKRLLEEIRTIPGIAGNQYYSRANSLSMEITQYEQGIMREEQFSPEQIEKLVRIYALSYRLNRLAVHRESVVLDPEATGYWSAFAPYYM
jgi:hypothetical protein